jgi:regulator of telomere elongation helicase 1
MVLIQLAIELRRCGIMLMEEAQAALDFGDNVLGGGGATAHAAEPKLNMFATALDRLLQAAQGLSSDYRLYVSEEKVKQFLNRNDFKAGLAAANKAVTKRVVNYWCFSTGVALEELVTLNLRSMIITSGTLSPMGAMKEDLRIPFNVELQNPHVIQ